jgi:hypothetical protein
MNYIRLCVNKSHKIPKFIENINVMRKTNSINNLEILLFDFCQYLNDTEVSFKRELQL